MCVYRGETGLRKIDMAIPVADIVRSKLALLADEA